jgi:aminoglycoside phosphotransferase (APT) family kinase protein
MIAPPPETTREIENALARHGTRPRAIRLVSTLQERKGRRWAYRVDADDGRVVKARLFENDDVARLAFELRNGLEEAFAPALARYGAVLIEEWIDGVPLNDLDPEARAGEAGALLGRLHAMPLAAGASVTFATHRWRERAESDLVLLETAGRLDSREIAALRAEVGRRDPAEARAVLAHLDFCADNMLVDGRGRLRVIDNELVSVAPAALDLARTFDLWPLPDPAWARFRGGYESTAPSRPKASGFWRIVTALMSARIFLHRSPERLDAALARLRRFVAGEGLSDP